jgi:hypothetical protein
MLLDAMAGHERDQSPQLVDLASINENPGNMPGKSFLCGAQSINSSKVFREF